MTVADYAFLPHPSIGALRAASIKHVGRYVSSNPANDSNGKNLIPSEFKALRLAGIGVVLFAEEGAQDMLGGHSRGVERARHFDAVAKALGAPDAVMVCTADWDATPAQQTPINAYLDGVNDTIGIDRNALYGGYYVVSRALNAGKVKRAVQTYAWSGFSLAATAAERAAAEPVNLFNLLGNPYTLMSVHDQGFGGPTGQFVEEDAVAGAALPPHAVLVSSVAGRNLPGTFLFDDRAGLRQGPQGSLGGVTVDFDQTVRDDFCQWPRPKSGPTSKGGFWFSTNGNQSLAGVCRTLASQDINITPAHLLRATCVKNDGHWDAPGGSGQLGDWLNFVLGDPVQNPHAVMPADTKIWVPPL